MDRRFWWLDTSDLALARAKLDKVKADQLSGWSLISWDESDFPSPEEAELSLLREIGIPSMFSEGKVICCQGLPSFHQKIAKGLDQIPEGILLVIMSQILKTTSLYLNAKKDAKKFCLDEAKDITKPKERIEFVAQRAAQVGIRIDEECCYALAQLCGSSHDMLTNEMKKLRACSEDGRVTREDIDEICSAEGEAVLYDLTAKIAFNDPGPAHELLRRLLLTTDPHAIIGFLCSWARALCVSWSCGCDFERCKLAMAGVSKLEKVGEGKKRRVALFSNENRFYHSIRELTEGNHYAHWPLVVMAECHRLELASRLMRDKENLSKEMHRFLERVMGEDEPTTLRTLPIPSFGPARKREERKLSKEYEVLNEGSKDD
jgi:hypothetical protein